MWSWFHRLNAYQNRSGIWWTGELGVGGELGRALVNSDLGLRSSVVSTKKGTT
jgi:hypothetical protein